MNFFELASYVLEKTGGVHPRSLSNLNSTLKYSASSFHPSISNTNKCFPVGRIINRYLQKCTLNFISNCLLCVLCSLRGPWRQGDDAMTCKWIGFEWGWIVQSHQSVSHPGVIWVQCPEINQDNWRWSRNFLGIPIDKFCRVDITEVTLLILLHVKMRMNYIPFSIFTNEIFDLLNLFLLLCHDVKMLTHLRLFITVCYLWTFLIHNNFLIQQLTIMEDWKLNAYTVKHHFVSCTGFSII